jgi:hypothetical protein
MKLRLENYLKREVEKVMLERFVKEGGGRI